MKDSRVTEGGKSFLLSKTQYPDRTNDMKNTIFTALLMTASLTACSDHENAEHREPGFTVESVEEASDYGIFTMMDDDSALLSEDSLIKKIPELDIEIHEIATQDQLELEPEWVSYESRYSVVKLKDLSTRSQLWHELSQRSRVSLTYVGAAPKNLLKLCEMERVRVKGLEQSKETIYESDLLDGIIASVKKRADYIYLPVLDKDLTPLTRRAIDYAKSRRVRVFDQEGRFIR